MTAPHELSGNACAGLLTDNFTREKLFVVEHKPDPYPYPLATGDGLIVTNSYWLAPARWFKPAWDYLLPDGAGITEGIWEIRYPEGRRGRKPFLYHLDNLDDATAGAFVNYVEADQYQTRLEPKLIDGLQAAIRPRDEWLAVYRRAIDHHGGASSLLERVAVRIDYLDLLTADGRPSTLKAAYGYRYDDTDAVTLRQVSKGPMGAIGIFYDRTNHIDAHHEDGPGMERVYVGAVDEPEGSKLAAVVMPQRWPNGS
jgi:hypothetical protein